MHARPAIERMSFRRAPLAAAAICFAGGIVLARLQTARCVWISLPVLLAALALLGALAGASLLGKQRVAAFPVAAVWVVLGVAAAEWQPGPVIPLQLMSDADNLSRTVRGRVVRVREMPTLAESTDADAVPPWEAVEEVRESSGRRLSIDLAVDAVEQVTPDTAAMVPATGGVRISVYEAEAARFEPRCGDQLEMPLRMKLPVRYRDPGAFQYADYLLEQQGIAAQASVGGAQMAVIGSAEKTWPCRLRAAQAWASGRLNGFARSAANRSVPRGLRLTETDALMLDAMLFGDRAGLTHGLRVGFERTGTFHLFVVSGLHLALLAGSLFWLLRRLRAPAWMATLLTLAASGAYAALTGFGQPAQRALVMTSVYLLARLLSRDRDSLNALGAAVLALLVWAPKSLFEASFQMTVLVIMAIAGIAVPLTHRSFLRYGRWTREVFREGRARGEPREAQFVLMLEVWGEAFAALLGGWAKKLPAMALGVLFWALELAMVGVVVELIMVLPMATYFHRAAIFGLPANMVALPVVGLLAGSAVTTFACSLVSSWLAVIPGVLTAGLLHGVTWVISRISHLAAADVRVPGPVWWVAALALVGWAGCCWAVRRSSWGAVAAGLALPALAALVLWPEPMVRTPGTLEVSAIDVGQGDSVLVVNPDGRAMLVDAGGPIGHHGAGIYGSGEVVANFDVGEEVVAPYLWSRRARRLDLVVLTHAHTDHMGGMPAVLADLRPRELWVSIDPRSPLYSALLEQAHHLGITVRHVHAGDEMPWGPVRISVLSPAAGYRNPGTPKNDDSVVLRMDYGKASALLEGDAEKPSEAAMLADGRVHPVTLLKVGHHGSRTSSTEEFLAAAAPQVAVVSVGLNNTFGHPRREVLDRLAARGTRLARTDEFGLSTYLLSPDGSVANGIQPGGLGAPD